MGQKVGPAHLTLGSTTKNKAAMNDNLNHHAKKVDMHVTKPTAIASELGDRNKEKSTKTDWIRAT